MDLIRSVASVSTDPVSSGALRVPFQKPVKRRLTTELGNRNKNSGSFFKNLAMRFET